MAFLQLLFGICRGKFSVNVPGLAFVNPWLSLSEGKGKAAELQADCVVSGVL